MTRMESSDEECLCVSIGIEDGGASRTGRLQPVYNKHMAQVWLTVQKGSSMVCEFEDLQNQDKAGYDVEGGLLLVCSRIQIW